MFGDDPRTRTIGVAGGAVILLLSVLAMSRPDADPTPPSQAEVQAECRRLYTDLNPAFRAVPTQRFEVRHDEDLLRVYVSEPDEWISVCRSGTQGVKQAFGTRMQDGPAGLLRLFDVEDPAAKANLVLGHLPAGAATIEAKLASGESITGTHDGDVFAVWSPNSNVTGAQLTAVGPNATVVATTTVP